MLDDTYYRSNTWFVRAEALPQAIYVSMLYEQRGAQAVGEGGGLGKNT